MKHCTPKHLQVSTASGVTHEKILLSQVAWCGKETVRLVVLSNQSVSFFAVSGQLLFSVPLPASVQFARGVVEISPSVIAIGLSSGDLMLVNASMPANPLIERLTGWSSPITALTAYGSYFASSSEQGDVRVWDTKTRKVSWIVTDQGPLCTALAMVTDFLIVGLLSGTINIYNFLKQVMLTSIQAHSRAVYGLTLHSTGTWLASVGEDQRVVVWAMPSSITAANDTEPTRMIFSSTLPSCMLTGVVFVGTDLCVASYDVDNLVVFKNEFDS